MIDVDIIAIDDISDLWLKKEIKFLKNMKNVLR